MPTFLKSAKPASRGKVRCSLCNRIIQQAEKYDRTTWVYDGRVYDWSECDRCKEFKREIDIYDRLGQPDEGYNRDDLFGGVEPWTVREARLIALARMGWTVRGRLLPYPAPDPAPFTRYSGTAGSKVDAALGGDEPPPCVDHRETQHRDGQPPWCNACGWRRAKPGTPAQQVKP